MRPHERLKCLVNNEVMGRYFDGYLKIPKSLVQTFGKHDH